MSQNIKTTITRLVAAVALCAVIFAMFPGASIAQDEASSLQQLIDKLVTSYNKKDAVAYRENFSEKLKEKFTLEKIENILDVGVDEQDSIISHSADISPDGRRALVFVETESEKLDLHIRINSDNKIERLSWYSHKADPSGLDLSDHEKRKIKERYQPYADQFAEAFRDTNAELILSLMKKDDDDDKTVEDYHSFIAQMHGRWGELIETGKLEVNDPSSVLLPIYFEGQAMGFYMKFDETNKISQLKISNYAPPESVGKTYADLGSDTLRTRDLLDFGQLQEAFKKDSGKVRLITLLSPT
ncbi:MAG: hypothetical protein IIC66_06385 [candidate division Zixibacteria bacterium]|nr:hypothetical protein [candidate division Zixibacteria bacterium]